MVLDATEENAEPEPHPHRDPANALRRAQRWLGLMFFGVLTPLVFVVVLNIIFGVFYDTNHFADTLFILGAGWRVAQGLGPVIDFGHFYGGVIATGLGKTMEIFGPSVFAFDIFLLFFLLFVIVSSFIVLRDRVSFAGMTALFLTLAILILTRHPLEINEPIVDIVSTHSFLYNRIGLSIFLIAGLFVAIEARSKRHDLLPGAAIGFLVVLAALTKPSFIVLAPAVMVGLALQRRWSGLVTVLVGIAISVAILDPTLERWTGSLEYLQSQSGDHASAQPMALLTKAVRLPFSQPLATALALAGLFFLMASGAKITSVLALLVMLAAGLGMESTMGWNHHLGQLAVPLAILTTLAAGEILRRSGLKIAAPVQVSSYILVAAFAVPHALNLFGATLEGVARRDSILMTSGPYERYLSLPDGALRRDAPSQYEMFADGVSALHRLGDPSAWGIVAASGISFEHAVLGPPVPGYPMWQLASSPELAEDKPIAPEADIVMIGRNGLTNRLGEILTSKLDPDFALCTTSVHWQIFARQDIDIRCDE